MVMIRAQKISERLPERRFRGKMAARRPDDCLERIEGAGSEIAINNPECSKRGGWCGLASNARKRRIVFLNHVGWHDPGLLALLIDVPR
jgi:hypothetical protein